MQHDDDTVRLRAYEIWEQSGRPHGLHEHHWLQAQSELVGLIPPTPMLPDVIRPPLTAARRRTRASL